jgi:predicted transcriptional regulator
MSSSKKDLAFITTNVVVIHTLVGYEMREPKLGKLELQIMETLWTRGQASIREIQEAFPERARPAYTTIQTTVYRLEGKKAVRRVRKLGNFHIFEAAVSRSAAQRKLIDDLLTLFGGRTQPVMAHLIEAGKLTLEDVKEAEKTLRRLEGKDKST